MFVFFSSVLIILLKPSDLLHPLVHRALLRALSGGREDDANARLLFRLFNHPEFGIESDLGTVVKQQPLAALWALELSCGVISSPDKLAAAAELCLETFFTWSSDWAAALASLSPPELEPEEFFEAAVRDQCVLTLVACGAKSKDSVRMVQNWLMQLRITPTMCWKVPLLWGMVLAGSSQAPPEVLKSLIELSRDNLSSGLVSMLGFGEKSPFPVEFRLFCRVLKNFVAPDANEMRALQASDPRLVHVVAWLEKRQPLAKALQCVEMTGTVLYPHSKAWAL